MSILKRGIFSLMVLGSLLLVSCATLEQVYVCTGPSATKYHDSDECWGLNRCKNRIKKVSIEEAEEMGYDSCKICYE